MRPGGLSPGEFVQAPGLHLIMYVLAGCLLLWVLS